MNRKNIFVYGISATAILLTIAGCSTPTITADYTMLPKGISDIKGIDTMEIVVNAEMQNSEDAAIAKAIICEKIAAGFTREGFFRTTDLIWGNPVGATQMHSVLQKKGSRHGYARITTEPVTPRARMEITFKADVKSSDATLNVKTNLKKVYYKTEKRKQKISWGKGEKKHTETIYVPYSVPDRTKKSVAMSKVKQHNISAAGTLDVKVFDKNGKNVYQKSFKGLKASARCDHRSLSAPLSKASLLSKMSEKVVASIVKDLSPYKESKSVKINKDGDERGFLLLSALAFSEAYDVFQKIDEKERTFADWENLGVICEALGDYEEAKRCFEAAVKVKKADKGFFDYDKNIAEDGIVRINNVINAQKKLEKIK